MRTSFLGRILTAGLIGTLCLALAGGSGNTLEGIYHHTAGGAMVLDFKGSKVTMTFAGQSETYDYKVDGDKIIIIDPKEGNLELTRNSDGSLMGRRGSRPWWLRTNTTAGR
jgi:hypothetical protein